MEKAGFHINKFLLDMSRKYHLSRFYLGDPMIMQLEVTTYCNIRCVQCPRQGEFSDIMDLNRNMPFEQFSFIIKQFPYLRRITFSGMGEPLLYPNIFEAVDYVKKVRKNAEVAVSTNSTLFIDSKVIDKLFSSGIDIIQVSWPGAREETVERLCGIKDFLKIAEAAKELVNRKPASLRVHINFVVMEENIDELEELVKLAYSTGIKHISAARRNYLSCRKSDGENADFYNSKELALKIKKAKALAESLGMQLLYDPKPKCKSLWDYITINVDGYVLPCGSYNMPRLYNLGNIITQDKKTIYHSGLLRSLRAGIAAKKRPPLCKNCYLVWS